MREDFADRIGGFRHYSPPLPMNEGIRETVDFLDRYVGPVESTPRRGLTVNKSR